MTGFDGGFVCAFARIDGLFAERLGVVVRVDSWLNRSRGDPLPWGLLQAKVRGGKDGMPAWPFGTWLPAASNQHVRRRRFQPCDSAQDHEGGGSCFVVLLFQGRVYLSDGKEIAGSELCERLRTYYIFKHSQGSTSDNFHEILFTCSRFMQVRHALNSPAPKWYPACARACARARDLFIFIFSA